MKSALLNHDELTGKDILSLYERKFDCKTRGRDLGAAGVRKFEVDVEWKRGWGWKVDTRSPTHPAGFTVYTPNDAFAGARPSAGTWWPTEGDVEILSASPKRGRVRVRMQTVNAVVDGTFDVAVCDGR